MPLLPSPPTTAPTAPSGFGSFISHVPYLNVLYNGGGSLLHAAQGTLGQWGPSPSLAGRITQWLFPNIGQAPSATAVNTGTPFGPPAPPGTQAPGGQYGPPAPTAMTGGAPAQANSPVNGIQTLGQFLANNPNVARYFSDPNFYNANRGNFAPTFQQGAFPGSAIGPFQGPAVPYGSDPRAQQGLGTPNIVDPSLPGWAGSLMADIRARNQI